MNGACKIHNPHILQTIYLRIKSNCAPLIIICIVIIACLANVNNRQTDLFCHHMLQWITKCGIWGTGHRWLEHSTYLLSLILFFSILSVSFIQLKSHCVEGRWKVSNTEFRVAKKWWRIILFNRYFPAPHRTWSVADSTFHDNIHFDQSSDKIHTETNNNNSFFSAVLKLKM